MSHETDPESNNQPQNEPKKPARSMWDTFNDGIVNEFQDPKQQVSDEMEEVGVKKVDELKISENTQSEEALQRERNLALMKQLDLIIPGENERGFLQLDYTEPNEYMDKWLFSIDMERNIDKTGAKTIVVNRHSDLDGKISYQTPFGVVPNVFIDQNDQLRAAHTKYVYDEKGNATNEFKIYSTSYTSLSKGQLVRVDFLSKEILDNGMTYPMNEFDHGLVTSYITLYRQGKFFVAQCNPEE